MVKCDSRQHLSVFIPSAAQSIGKYFNRRQALMKTWVRDMNTIFQSIVGNTHYGRGRLAATVHPICGTIAIFDDIICYNLLKVFSNAHNNRSSDLI